MGKFSLDSSFKYYKWIRHGGLSDQKLFIIFSVWHWHDVLDYDETENEMSCYQRFRLYSYEDLRRF